MAISTEAKKITEHVRSGALRRVDGAGVGIYSLVFRRTKDVDPAADFVCASYVHFRPRSNRQIPADARVAQLIPA
jgi:hypothetical protein